MSGSEITTPPTYYGRYLFANSLTYNEWARLTAKDIHTALHHRTGFEGQDVWFYSNHPIRWVRIVGVVVAYDDLENRYILTRMLPLDPRHLKRRRMRLKFSQWMMALATRSTLSRGRPRRPVGNPRKWHR